MPVIPELSGPARKASGRSMNNSSTRSWSNPSGRAQGFLEPVSAVAIPAVSIPTPWFRPSWLPKHESHGIPRPGEENSRRARSSSPGWSGKPKASRNRSGPPGPTPSGFQKMSSGQSSDWTPA